jgi:DNA-binding NarL/FixJ family response regulator
MELCTITYVSPRTSANAGKSLCEQLPINLHPVESIEELYPLMSDPNFHTDYVAVCLETLYEKQYTDPFSVLLTLDTLIKGTVRRTCGQLKPQKRDTKITILVNQGTDPESIKQVINLPYVYAAAMVLEREDQIPDTIEYIKKLTAGEATHDTRVLELLKPKKIKKKRPNEIELTTRQSQILKLIQERGCSNKHIAKILNLTESTVKLHVGGILKKYNLKNRTQLAVFSK